MWILRDSHQHKLFCTFETEEEAQNFVGRLARLFNYGLYRFWEVDAIKYYDCGPRTYELLREEKDEER